MNNADFSQLHAFNETLKEISVNLISLNFLWFIFQLVREVINLSPYVVSYYLRFLPWLSILSHQRPMKSPKGRGSFSKRGKLRNNLVIY